ncbi:DNA-binding protein [Colletotrichum truncatum]|uniref:DNA-binding protein n=1 Tax=Colletotrichum truncatum TaxID=5467 RepID=A0ACC3ZJC1_COLTU|nr:DNA-binding protein [Colletotrichum truncatum]KAF6782367.1 DNA-binding protein [Colletotrichum truncatum]
MSMDPEADYPTDEGEIEGYSSHEIRPFHATEFSQSGLESRQADTSSDSEETVIRKSRPSQKRRAEGEAIEPILKRHKGHFNSKYLDLLNGDIVDAANQNAVSTADELPLSQIGLTIWTPFEKKLFFEALSKLGKDNLKGISDKIRSKSEVEVRQYITLLQDAIERREQEQERGLESLELAEYPAAVEISQPCCFALEEAADALSLRQERHEELVEQKRWGECWNITQELAKRIEGDHGLEKDPNFASNHGLAFTEVFRIKNFLQLPERMFMNAAYAENNWQYISEEPPTIRATAMQDFHSLLVSLTKKIVLTTLFMAESRIRAKRKVEPSTKGLVRRKDVEAAVASLGMKQDSNEFWVTSARRLRLEVWDEGPESPESTSQETDGEEQPMSYDEVEKALRQDLDITQLKHTEDTSQTRGTKVEDVEVIASESEQDEEAGSGHPDSDSSIPMNDAEHEVNEEAKEVLHYAAYDFPETHRTREALKHRIRNERAHEAYAEAEDAKASYETEMEMWRLLQRQPPESLVKPVSLNRSRRVMKNVEEIYDVGRQWRGMLTYHSEWEMLGASKLPTRKP